MSGTNNRVVSAGPHSEEVRKEIRLILDEFLLNTNYKVYALPVFSHCHSVATHYVLFCLKHLSGVLSSVGDIIITLSCKSNWILLLCV